MEVAVRKQIEFARRYHEPLLPCPPPCEGAYRAEQDEQENDSTLHREPS